MKKNGKSALRTLKTAELEQAKGGVKLGLVQIRYFARLELLRREAAVKLGDYDGI